MAAVGQRHLMIGQQYGALHLYEISHGRVRDLHKSFKDASMCVNYLAENGLTRGVTLTVDGTTVDDYTTAEIAEQVLAVNEHD